MVCRLFSAKLLLETMLSQLGPHEQHLVKRESKGIIFTKENAFEMLCASRPFCPSVNMFASRNV